MSQLAKTIMSSATALPEGGLVAPKEFLHLGSRAAIDQTFTRLCREGKLLRIARGSYARPISGRFGSRAPSTESIIKSLETREGKIIVPSCAAAANTLGLTTQVPMREVFITNGKPKAIRLGKIVVEMKRAPSWQLALGHRLAGTAIRAAAWGGQERIKEILPILKSNLPKAEWESMISARAILPAWLAKAISEASYA